MERKLGNGCQQEGKGLCSLVGEKLKEYNPYSSVESVNVVKWETNPTMDVKPMQRGVLEGKDIIIIRLGDNVQAVDAFHSELQLLLNYCK